MIFLFTDFSHDDLYAGQLHVSIARTAPNSPVIDLLHSVPNFNIRAGAYLLAALATTLPEQAIVVGVVDPGVGGSRRPLLLRVDGRWFVGPDNGLFNIVVKRAARVESYEIDWRPPSLSTSFHGRDLFAPVAAQLAVGRMPACSSCTFTDPQPEEWPDALWEIIYIDHYGNAITGVAGRDADDQTILNAGGRRIAYASTFCAVERGAPFWFRNSLRLVEIAVNQGRACDVLNLAVGDSIGAK